MNQDKDGERNIHRHESALQKAVLDSKNIEYKPLKSLQEARKYNDAHVIFEGDYGGQVYLSVPVKKIKCSQTVLDKLLKELDAIAWKDSTGTGLYFERIKKGEIISGGMGGGRAKNNLWVHKDLSNFRRKILLVLQGRSNGIEND